ncbi:hypothetical protein G7A72_03210 [Flavobacterium sp. Sr18]|uniref:hypothetical protein n=1 Tax=Flavobacterium sp. Sr18 TaxID=935222 RepID=UPI0013E4E70C|nr:hypothetical protein [Flavobacterium sp. Sr18]QIH37868.1 hypothetical protein G7A72_03210 [Flavobacterium sp. Sr18]
MIQTGLKITTIGKFLKEYLSVLIIVPAFIGGLWQAFELMSISIPYIRFFSISQIVPDGILILMFLVTAFSFYPIAWFADILFFIKDEPKATEYLDVEKYEKYRQSELNTSMFLFSFYYVLLVYYYLYFINDKSNFSKIETSAVTSFFAFYLLNVYLNRCFFYAKEKHKKIIKGCNILLLLLYIIATIYFYKRIHNIFIAPNNIINIEQVKLDVAKKYPNTKQKLLYFNDKYMFIKIIEGFKKDKKGKIIKHTNEKIYIMKLESLFTDESENKN